MNLTMYDAARNSQFPPGGDAYAAYVDGALEDQPNYAYIVRAFPAAHHLSIALYASHDADALDIENGAAKPEDVPGWYARQKARGVHRPCLYASVSTMEERVVPVMLAAQIPRQAVRLWSAHYGAGRHICGPSTCRLVSVEMDGTQWADMTGSLVADQSLLLGDFFGATPQQWTEFDMARLPVLHQGDNDSVGAGFWSVHRLQDLLALTGRLNGIAAAQVKTDGDFGPKTAAAVRAVEEHYREQYPHMIVDAQGSEKAGPQVWGVLLTGSPG